MKIWCQIFKLKSKKAAHVQFSNGKNHKNRNDEFAYFFSYTFCKNI